MSFQCVIIADNFHLPHDKLELVKPEPQPTYLASTHHNLHSSHMQPLFPKDTLMQFIMSHDKILFTSKSKSNLIIFFRRLSKFYLFQVEHFVIISTFSLFKWHYLYTSILLLRNLMIIQFSHQILISSRARMLEPQNPTHSWPGIWCVLTAYLGRNKGRGKTGKVYDNMAKKIENKFPNTESESWTLILKNCQPLPSSLIFIQSFPFFFNSVQFPPTLTPSAVLMALVHQDLI